MDLLPNLLDGSLDEPLIGKGFQNDDGNLFHDTFHRPCPAEVPCDDADEEDNDRQYDTSDRIRQVKQEHG